LLCCYYELPSYACCVAAAPESRWLSSPVYNYSRDYDAVTGRYVQPDPIGLGSGLNPYLYAGGNPLRYIDPLGLDIAVVENGPTQGNPIGHTAIALTGAGVYSFGNRTPAGTNLSDYLRREADRRATTIYILPTTPQQDAAVLAYLRQYPNTELPTDLFDTLIADNCSVRSNEALDVAGFPRYTILNTPGGDAVLALPGSLPGSSGLRARMAGSSIVRLPQGSRHLPPALRQFERGAGLR
jgi:RHS repeat-associated protein